MRAHLRAASGFCLAHSPAIKATVEPLVAEHALAYSRDRVQPGILSAKALAELPPVRQRLYRDNPVNGRRAL